MDTYPPYLRHAASRPSSRSGRWKIGKGNPTAELEMDHLDFSIFVSRRFSYREGMEWARIFGDESLVENAFKDMLALY